MSKKPSQLQSDDIKKRRLEISTLVSSLYRSEQDGGKHKASSIEPTRGIISDQKQANLDVLGRVLTGGHICAALCFDGEQLLVANNTGNGDYIARCLTTLNSFANKPSKETYEELENIAKIESIRICNSLQNEESAKLRQATLVEGGSASSNDFLTKLASISTSQEVGTLYESAKAAIRDPAPAEVKSLSSDILRPLIDVRIVTNAIIMGGLEPEVVEAISGKKECAMQAQIDQWR